MRYLALACDYDGTIAHHGSVDPATHAALEKVVASGRKLLLVTGRELHDLERVFPHLELFDRIVAENGALLYRPKQREEVLLCEPPPQDFVRALQERRIEPLSVGRCIVATTEPHDAAVLEVIRDLGLELHVIFNKGAVMVLPSGINKSTGLSAALRDLGLSAHNVVGVGDAENDHAFLAECECSVALANAIETLKQRADYVTSGRNGTGVRELITDLLENDLLKRDARFGRNAILVGHDAAGSSVNLPSHGACALVAGRSGSGKSTLSAAVLERLSQRGYQFCVIDPEGDFGSLPGTVSIGDEKHPPSLDQLAQLLESFENIIVNMLGVSLPDRPDMFAAVLDRIGDMQRRTGRPHWLIVDEAHHVLPKMRSSPKSAQQWLDSALLITVHPDHVSQSTLHAVNTLFVVGKRPEETFKAFCSAVGQVVPKLPHDLHREEPNVLAWFRHSDANPIQIQIEPGTAERQRHRRKYAHGDVQEKSFFFRGPEGKLNLRAQNLNLFVQMADGVDDETWSHHLRQGDYSRWIREAIKDKSLAEEVAAIESAQLPPEDSRARIKDAIEREYTSSA